MAQISDLVGNDTLKGLKDFLDNLVDEKRIENSYSKGLANELKKTFGNLAVKNNGSYISVAYRILNDSADNQIGFYDLKPYFESSSKAKPTKDGGWYLRVPISNKATEYRQAFGRKLWDTISHTEFGTTSNADENIARFQKILSNGGGIMSSPLAYQWKSTNVTRERFGSSQTRGSYVSFRSVSNKSDPNSWLVGRSNMANQISNNTDSQADAEEVAKIVRQAINHIAENYSKKGGVLS